MAERCRTGDVRADRAELGRGRRAVGASARGGRAGARDLARHRRQRGRAGAAGDDLQRAPLPLARRRARAAPPQADADEPRAARLGARRRARARGGRDRLRPGRRADLLGELHAARADGDLRVGRRDLRRVDRGRRGRMAGDARPHRAREPRVRRRAVRVPARLVVPGRLPAARRARRRRAPRPWRERDPRAGRLVPRRPGVRRGDDPLRGAPAGGASRRSSALRPCRPLQPARRAAARVRGVRPRT